MRRTILLALAALLFSAALCTVSAVSVSRAVNRAEAFRQEAERAARLGDLAGAADILRDMASDWQSRGRVLELVTAHDALSDVQGNISEALICLEQGERNEFFRAAAALAAALERLRAAEAVRLMNMF